MTSRDPVNIDDPAKREPVSKSEIPKYRLEDLLARVTAENRHAEIDTGPSVGKEAW
jgi:antitoxin component of MazEF toxin-antitoxin module